MRNSRRSLLRCGCALPAKTKRLALGALFRQPGHYQMIAEQPPLAGILEGMALGEGANPEVWVELPQRLADRARLLELAVRREAGGEEAHVADEARIGRQRAAPPLDCVGPVAGGVARQPDQPVAEEHMRVVRREPEPDIDPAPRLARLADVAEGGAAAQPGDGRARVGRECPVEQLDRLVVVAE